MIRAARWSLAIALTLSATSSAFAQVMGGPQIVSPFFLNPYANPPVNMNLVPYMASPNMSISPSQTTSLLRMMATGQAVPTTAWGAPGLRRPSSNVKRWAGMHNPDPTDAPEPPANLAKTPGGRSARFFRPVGSAMGLLTTPHSYFSRGRVNPRGPH